MSVRALPAEMKARWVAASFAVFALAPLLDPSGESFAWIAVNVAVMLSVAVGVFMRWRVMRVVARVIMGVSAAFATLSGIFWIATLVSVGPEREIVFAIGASLVVLAVGAWSATWLGSDEAKIWFTREAAQ
ncbi:hypothetical protein ACQQ2N_07120 [Dokdonella sp. MW10]|uniref:hypothetical protein n=1 Tax=Dokdonella sp. MW10 TaxID=2992926 RepID=UPI003F7F0805